MAILASRYSFPERKYYNIEFEGIYRTMEYRGNQVLVRDPNRRVKYLRKYLKNKTDWCENGQTIVVSWRMDEEDWTKWWGQRFILRGGIWISIGPAHETSWDRNAD